MEEKIHEKFVPKAILLSACLSSPGWPSPQATAHVSCFGGTKHSSVEPSSSPAVCFYWWRQKTWGPVPQWNTTILQALRLVFLCGKTCGTYSIFSDTVEKCPFARAGWGLLSMISITQALTVPPFSCRDTRYTLGSLAVLKMHSFISHKSQCFPLLQVDRLKMIKTKRLNTLILST